MASEPICHLPARHASAEKRHEMMGRRYRNIARHCYRKLHARAVGESEIHLAVRLVASFPAGITGTVEQRGKGRAHAICRMCCWQ